MNEEIIKAISEKLTITIKQVVSTLELLEQGNTVPFIARYRKEMTDGLDEEQILYIQKQYEYEVKLAQRKESVLKLISEQGKLTDEIKDSVNARTKLSRSKTFIVLMPRRKKRGRRLPSRMAYNLLRIGC